MTEAQIFELVSNYDFVSGASRIYRKNGVAVIIPDALAADLENWRKEYDGGKLPTHLKSEPHDTIFGVLSLLPNPGLVSEIILGNMQTGEPVETLFYAPTARAMEPGRLILPDVLPLSEVSRAVVEGWARMVWLTYTVETHFFRYAAFLENTEIREDSPATYDFEYFALYTVRDFFLADEKEFKQFLSTLPLQAVTLGRALKRACDEDASHASKHIHHCIDAVESEALPVAQQKLLEIVKTEPGESEKFAAALKLLITMASPEQLATLPLSDIVLSHEPLQPDDLCKLGKITSLERLNLSQSAITREGTGFLKDLVNLKQLDLSNTRIMSTSLNPLRGAPNLEELDISNTAVNDSILSILPKLPALKRVKVVGTDLSNVDDLRAALPGCTVTG